MTPVDAQTCIEVLKAGNKILICGNGGSAAMAAHFAAELVVRFAKNRRALACINLCADQAILTACANDLGYERVFARQVEAYGKKGDVLIALSTSGKSSNVNFAIARAHDFGLHVIESPRDFALLFCSTSVIQEKQLEWLHELAEAIENAFA